MKEVTFHPFVLKGFDSASHSILRLPKLVLSCRLEADWFIVFCPKLVQSCLTPNPMDSSLPGFSVLGILQARLPEWVAISSPNGVLCSPTRSPLEFCLLMFWQHSEPSPLFSQKSCECGVTFRYLLPLV